MLKAIVRVHINRHNSEGNRVEHWSYVLVVFEKTKHWLMTRQVSNYLSTWFSGTSPDWTCVVHFQRFCRYSWRSWSCQLTRGQVTLSGFSGFEVFRPSYLIHTEFQTEDDIRSAEERLLFFSARKPLDISCLAGGEVWKGALWHLV